MQEEVPRETVARSNSVIGRARAKRQDAALCAAGTQTKKERAGRTTARQTGGLAPRCNPHAKAFRTATQPSGAQESASRRLRVCKKVQEVKIVQPRPPPPAAELRRCRGRGRGVTLAHLLLKHRPYFQIPSSCRVRSVPTPEEMRMTYKYTIEALRELISVRDDSEQALR